MKNFTLLCFGAISILFLLISCQKEIEIEPSAPPVVVSHPPVLKAYIEFDTTRPVGVDTADKTYFDYDGQGRILKITRYLQLFSSVQIHRYFYNGNDLLPYKRVMENTRAADVNSDTTFFTYSADGIVTRDSTISWKLSTNSFNQVQSRHFTASGMNTLVSVRKYFNPALSTPDYEWSGLISKTYLNGNIVQQQDTTTSWYSVTGYSSQTWNNDNKPNPVYGLYPRYPFLGDFSIQKNNPIDIIVWNDPSLQEHHQYFYRYRVDGYPAEVRFALQGIPGKGKGVFYYQ